MNWRILAVLLAQACILIGCGKPDTKRSDAQPSDVASQSDGNPETAPPADPESGESGVNDSNKGGETPVDPTDAPRSPISSFPESVDAYTDSEPPRTRHIQPEPSFSMAPPRAMRAPAEIEPVESIRAWKEGEQYKTVTVFYGTDRAHTHDDLVGLNWQIAHYAIAGIAILFGLIAGIVLTARSQKRLAAFVVILTIGGGVLFLKFVPLNVPMRMFVADKGIPKYGGERGDLVMGACKVTIPRTHTTGTVERPDIRRFEVNEDVRKHVVLADVQPLPDSEFFEELQRAVERSPRKDLFLFVHGYNVTFEHAALRTAQMAYDLEFEGAPVFYSWPSQGVYWKYTIDENNVSWAVPDLKRFLLDIAKHSGAKSINLIAHSMGNRALTQALQDITHELQDDPLLFNQLILAAPDIDADTFKRRIAPAIRKTARRTTLYASSNDNALIASKKVHGYPRAGESGPHLLVVPGIHTIDVSDIESGVLGHSYYASSDLVLTDLKELFNDVAPMLRRWLREVKREGLTYWVYYKAHATLESKEDVAEKP